MHILITGGSKGIGLALRQAYEAEGHKVTSWSRSEGGGISLRERDCIELAASKLSEPLDLVVHNAGCYSQDNGRPNYLNYHLELNVGGPAWVQCTLVSMQKLALNATIATVLTSDLSRCPQLKGQLGYNVSKWALYGLVQSWQAEYPYFKYVELYPKVTSGTGMYDPTLGPAEATLEQTVKYMKDEIDAALLSSR
jgi:NAD(P)-dependent dehydrogenase (short-subunit alcohol dehydrogenase family)